MKPETGVDSMGWGAATAATAKNPWDNAIIFAFGSSEASKNSATTC